MPQELKFKTTNDASQFFAALGKVEAGAQATAGKVTGAFKNLAGPLLALGPAIAAAFTGKAIAAGVEGVFAGGRALQVLSRQTGVSVQGLVILQDKFKKAGLDGDMVATSMFRLQRALAGAEDDESRGVGARLKSLGIDLEKIRRMKPEEQFFAVGKALSKINDVNARGAALQQVFGRGGGQLGAIFNKSGGSDVDEKLRQKAEIIARNAATFEQVSIKLERVGGILKTFYVGIADRLGTALIPVLDKLDKINLISAGQAFGNSLAEGATALLPVIDAFVKGIPTAVQYLTAGLTQLRAMLADDMRIIAAIKDVLSGKNQEDWEKDQAIKKQVAKIEEDKTNVRTDEDRVNDPLQQWSQEIVARNKVELEKDRKKLAEDEAELARLRGNAAKSPTAERVVIAPHWGTSLDLSSEDIARNEGRTYTGARNSDATIFNSGEDWRNAHGFTGTSLVGGGLSGGGLASGAYGRTGNIWSQISGRTNAAKDPAEATAKNTETMAGLMKDLRDQWKGGGGSSESGGATTTQ